MIVPHTLVIFCNSEVLKTANGKGFSVIAVVDRLTLVLTCRWVIHARAPPARFDPSTGMTAAAFAQVGSTASVASSLITPAVSEPGVSRLDRKSFTIENECSPFGEM